MSWMSELQAGTNAKVNAGSEPSGAEGGSTARAAVPYRPDPQEQGV